MTHYVFSEVAIWAEKAGHCPECGKAAKRRLKFWQTLNPFNVNKNGHVKTATEIREELKQERQDWLVLPTLHARCEEAMREREREAKRQARRATEPSVTEAKP